MSHQIYISVGSNVEREKHTRAGLDALAQAYGDITLSTVYESEAIGFTGSHFFNLVVGAQTEQTIAQVCQTLKQIESQNGRARGEKKFAPRTLDLDLLLYDDVVTDDGVQLPRAEIEYNAFVLLPLQEIAGAVIHPLTGLSLHAMWQQFDQSSQQLWPIEFDWRAPQP